MPCLSSCVTRVVLVRSLVCVLVHEPPPTPTPARPVRSLLYSSVVSCGFSYVLPCALRRAFPVCVDCQPFFMRFLMLTRCLPSCIVRALYVNFPMRHLVSISHALLVHFPLPVRSMWATFPFLAHSCITPCVALCVPNVFPSTPPPPLMCSLYVPRAYPHCITHPSPSSFPVNSLPTRLCHAEVWRKSGTRLSVVFAVVRTVPIHYNFYNFSRTFSQHMSNIPAIEILRPYSSISCLQSLSHLPPPSPSSPLPVVVPCVLDKGSLVPSCWSKGTQPQHRENKMADELDGFSGGKKFRVASVQHLPTENKEQNLQKLERLISNAVKEGAKLIVLPEFATTMAPNSEEDLRNFAEEIPGPSTDFMSKSARDHRIYIVGGSIIEKDSSGKLYNTCPVFDPQGHDLKIQKTTSLPNRSSWSIVRLSRIWNTRTWC